MKRVSRIFKTLSVFPKISIGGKRLEERSVELLRSVARLVLWQDVMAIRRPLEQGQGHRSDTCMERSPLADTPKRAAL